MGHSSRCAQARAPAIRIVLLTVGFKVLASIIEGGAAYYSGSFSLFGDALHLCVDIAAGVVGVLYLRRGQQSVSHARQERLEVRGSMIVGFLMMLMAATIAGRGWLLSDEHTVSSIPMLTAALIGLGINGVNLLLLSRHVGIGLMRMLRQHEALDLTSSAFVVVSAIAVWGTGSAIFDIIGGIAIGSVLFGWSAWQTLTLKTTGDV